MVCIEDQRCRLVLHTNAARWRRLYASLPPRKAAASGSHRSSQGLFQPGLFPTIPAPLFSIPQLLLLRSPILAMALGAGLLLHGLL